MHSKVSPAVVTIVIVVVVGLLGWALFAGFSASPVHHLTPPPKVDTSAPGAVPGHPGGLMPSREEQQGGAVPGHPGGFGGPGATGIPGH